MKYTDCERAGVVECFGLVKNCEKKSAKNGTFYLDMLLGDNEGDVAAKLWDYKDNGVALPEPNTVIKVRGTLQQYNGNNQLIVQRMRAAVASDNVNMSDFVKSAEVSGTAMYNAIIATVSSFEDEELKKLVLTLLEEKKEKLLFFPAAEKLHHAMTGGLLYHTLSIVRLAECVCGIYAYIDRDLLIAGAVLHDIAKLREYTVNAAGIVDGRTLEGSLIGHLVMGAEEVGRKADELGISSDKKYLLQHMLISHHGKPEFGAAVKPAFIEAEVLSQLDLFDANMYEMADAVKGVKPGEFTGKLWMLDNRKIYNHGRKEVSTQANIIESSSEG